MKKNNRKHILLFAVTLVLVLAVMSGCTVMLCDKFDANAIVIDLRTYPARSTDEPENDKVMRGSRDGFVETMIFNTAMIRRRIRDPKLTVKYLKKCGIPLVVRL